VGAAREKKMASNLVSLTIADAALSFLWVFCTSSFGFLSANIAKFLDWQGNRTPIIVGIVTVLIFTFSLIGRALGGASWNPTAPVAFYAAGVGKDSLFSLSVRLPAMVRLYSPFYHIL
jgi:aquaporin SIP